MASKSPRLTNNSRAVLMLKAKFERGELNGTEDPKIVWQSEPAFREYKLDTFRTRYNRTRSEMVGNGSSAARVIDCTTPQSNAGPSNQHKNKKRRLDDGGSGDSHSSNSSISNDKHALNPAVFKPLYLLSEWKEVERGTRRITAAILLPSGVGMGDFSLRVVEGGSSLELKCTWPEPLVDLKMLHKKWLNPIRSTNNNLEQMYAKYYGFEDALKNLRGTYNANVESTALLALPFAVETHIDEKHNLAWEVSSSRILYVDLKAHVEAYAVDNDTESFEVL